MYHTGRLRTTDWRPVGERVAKTPERLSVESEESDEDNNAYAGGHLSDDGESDAYTGDVGRGIDIGEEQDCNDGNEGFDVDALRDHFAAGSADHEFVDDTIGLFC